MGADPLVWAGGCVTLTPSLSVMIRIEPLKHGSELVVISPDRTKHRGTIIGISDGAKTIAVCVEKVRESELRWDDARARAILKNSPHKSLTLHFDAGHFDRPVDDGGALRFERVAQVLAQSDGGAGMREGTWVNAERWKWQRPLVKMRPVAGAKGGPKDAHGREVLEDFGGFDEGA